MVEWKKIGTICKPIAPPKKLGRDSYQEDGLYPIIDQGQNDIVGYTNDESSLLPNGEYVLFGDHTRFVKYHWGHFAQGADGLKILQTKEGVNARYFYFAFQNTEVPSRGYSRHWSIAKDLLIPIPHLSTQSHIVSILDTFTSSIANLKQQIEERRKQYEYERDRLLDLEGKEGVEMKKLGEVCEIKGRIGFRGYTRDDQVAEGEGAISLTATNIINQHIDYTKNTYITWEKYYESPEIMVQNGDIIVCQRGSIGKIALVENLKEKATINPQLLLLKNMKINNRFLAYNLLGRYFQYDLAQIIGHGTVQMIAQKDFKNLAIPVPSLEEQSHIVSILDTFEASIRNLEGQLALREKQYEYYRERLLRFEEG